VGGWLSGFWGLPFLRWGGGFVSCRQGALGAVCGGGRHEGEGRGVIAGAGRISVEVEFGWFEWEFEFSGVDICENIVVCRDEIVMGEPLRFAGVVDDEDFFAQHVLVDDAAESSSCEDAPSFFGDSASFFEAVAVFIAQAAIEPAANTADAFWIGGQSLRSQAFDGDGIKLSEESSAAETLPAGAQSTDEAGAVSQAELVHFDVQFQVGGQEGDHLAEIDPDIRGEVDGDIFVVVAQVGRQDLHLESVIKRVGSGQFLSAFFDGLILPVNFHILCIGVAQDVGEGVDFSNASVSVSDGGGKQDVSVHAHEYRHVWHDFFFVCVDFNEPL